MAYQYWWVSKEGVRAPEEIVKDETADWNIHRDEEWGFVVKYPNDWIVKKDKLENKVNFGEEKEMKVEISEGKYEKMNLFKIGCTVGFYRNISELWKNKEERLSLEDWISKTFLPLRKGETIDSVTFGVENYEGLLVEKFKEVGIIKIIPRIFIQKNGTIYEIRGEVPALPTTGEFFPTEHSYDKVFNQMLSTFKFIK